MIGAPSSTKHPITTCMPWRSGSRPVSIRTPTNPTEITHSPTAISLNITLSIQPADSTIGTPPSNKLRCTVSATAHYSATNTRLTDRLPPCRSSCTKTSTLSRT